MSVDILNHQHVYNTLGYCKECLIKKGDNMNTQDNGPHYTPTKHTPTPWKLEWVMDERRPIGLENAAFIVKAVNSYESNLKLLQLSHEIIDRLKHEINMLHPGIYIEEQTRETLHFATKLRKDIEKAGIVI